MNKATIKLTLTVATIVALGQSCAKDMTTQDFDAELAAENTAKMQVHAGTYRGAIKNSNGDAIAAATFTVSVETVNPGANNNASQNVGFGGTMVVDPQNSQELRLGYTGAYFDFSSAGNYRFNTKITMPDGTTSDTVEVGGQFPDNNTINGTMYAGAYPDKQYTLSFSLTRDGVSPSSSSLVSSQRSAVILGEGASTTAYAGTANFRDGTSDPMSMQIVSSLTEDEAFYAFVSPVSEVDVILQVNPQNPFELPIAFKNVQFNQIHNFFSGRSANSGVVDTTLTCSQLDGTPDWKCSTNSGDSFSAVFAPNSK